MIIHMVKRTLITTSIIVALLLTACISLPTFAAECGGVQTSIIECEGGGDAGVFHILNLIIDIFSIGIGILAVIGISWAGIQYLTAGGDEAKTTKAKRRIYEVVIGVVCYVLLWAGLKWLLPNVRSSVEHNNLQATEITISYNGTPKVGQTFAPKVTFTEDTNDKTYSLRSDNTGVITTIGMNAKCVAAGSAKITAVTSKGKTASTDVTCVESGSEGGNPDEQVGVGSATGEETVGNMENTPYKGGARMRPETQQTFNDHRKDFYYSNVDSVLRKSGGLISYIQNLDKDKNGVFYTYASQTNGNGIKKIPVKTAADLQKASEFVYGLMMIWGADYDIGRPSAYTQWTGDDAFYYNPRKHSGGYNSNSIIQFLKNKNEIRTNCNYSVATFHKSTTLKSLGGVGSAKQSHIKMSKVGKITKWSDLKVGDIVHFLSGGEWRHVAMVGEVYSDKVVLYDGGPFFPKRMTYKIPTPRTNSGGFPKGTPYTYYTSWWAFRPWNIDQSVTLGGING